MKSLAAGLWVAQLVATISMLVAAAINIETILITGPLVTLIGLLLAIVTGCVGSKAVLAYGLSGPLMCAFIATLIAAFSWGPDESRGPINAIITAYTILSIPVGVWVLYRIRQLPSQVYAEHAKQPLPWQFSLKTMLLVMTAVCVLIVAIQLMIPALPVNEAYIFGGYALACVALCAIVVWRFFMPRKKNNRTTTGCSVSLVENNNG